MQITCTFAMSAAIMHSSADGHYWPRYTLSRAAELRMFSGVLKLFVLEVLVALISAQVYAEVHGHMAWSHRRCSQISPGLKNPYGLCRRPERSLLHGTKVGHNCCINIDGKPESTRMLHLAMVLRCVLRATFDVGRFNWPAIRSQRNAS